MEWAYRVGFICVAALTALSLGFTFPQMYFYASFVVLFPAAMYCIWITTQFSFEGVTNKAYIDFNQRQLKRIEATVFILYFLSLPSVLLPYEGIHGCFDSFCLVYVGVNLYGLKRLKKEHERRMEMHKRERVADK